MTTQNKKVVDMDMMERAERLDQIQQNLMKAEKDPRAKGNKVLRDLGFLVDYVIFLELEIGENKK